MDDAGREKQEVQAVRERPAVVAATKSPGVEEGAQVVIKGAAKTTAPREALEMLAKPVSKYAESLADCEARGRLKNPVLKRCLEIVGEEQPEVVGQEVHVFKDGDKELQSKTGWGDFYAHSHERFLVYPEFGPGAVEQMMGSTFPSLVLPALARQLGVNVLRLPRQQQIDLLTAFTVFHEAGHTVHRRGITVGQGRAEDMARRKFEQESGRKERFRGRAYFLLGGGGSNVTTETGQVFTKQRLQLAKEYRQLTDERAADAFATAKIKKHLAEIIQ